MSTIVMTGGTAGFGAVAVDHLRRAGHEVLLGARRPDSVGAGVRAFTLDLADLDSVRQYADQVARHLNGRSADALVANAGIAYAHVDARTRQGWEATFGVNHLAHHLLLRLLAPHLREGARVILTTSSVHDPREGAPLAPPRHADVRLLADPREDPDLDAAPARAGGHAYSASKLCNLLVAGQLSREADTEHLVAVPFDPGPTPGTGLSRNYGLGMRIGWRLLGTPVGRLLPGLSSKPAVGRALATLVDEAPPGRDGQYLRFRRGQLSWAEASELARDTATAATVWADSARLAGVPPHRHTSGAEFDTSL